MVGGAAAHLHFAWFASVAPVLDVDALDRHLAPARLLENHLGAVVEIVAATTRTAWARVAGPLDPAEVAGELDPAVAEGGAAQVVVGAAGRADDVEGHLLTLRRTLPGGRPLDACARTRRRDDREIAAVPSQDVFRLSPVGPA